jgi:hypothetical protein
MGIHDHVNRGVIERNSRKKTFGDNFLLEPFNMRGRPEGIVITGINSVGHTYK